MEDHFILFPVMVVVFLFYAVWYTIQLVWLLVLFIAGIIKYVYKKITKRSEVNNRCN